MLRIRYFDQAAAEQFKAGNIDGDAIQALTWNRPLSVPAWHCGDAEQLYQLVREEPEKAYDDDFVSRIEA